MKIFFLNFFLLFCFGLFCSNKFSIITDESETSKVEDKIPLKDLGPLLNITGLIPELQNLILQYYNHPIFLMEDTGDIAALAASENLVGISRCKDFSIYDLKTHKVTKDFYQDDKITDLPSIAISDDEKYVAVSKWFDKTVAYIDIWSLDSKKIVKTIPVCKFAPIYSLNFVKSCLIYTVGFDNCVEVCNFLDSKEEFSSFARIYLFEYEDQVKAFMDSIDSKDKYTNCLYDNLTSRQSKNFVLIYDLRDPHKTKCFFNQRPEFNVFYFLNGKLESIRHTKEEEIRYMAISNDKRKIIFNDIKDRAKVFIYFK